MRRGLFIEHLVESLLPAPTPGFDDADLAEATQWLEPSLFEPDSVEAVRQAFADGGRIPHVCLDRPLQMKRADAVGRALVRAKFADHHHDAYKVQIARRERQSPSALTRFVDWLASPAAARLHRAWVGFPSDTALTLDFVQVQTARARAGDHFPEHVDTQQEGLAAVYAFTRDFAPEDGGVLRFGDELQIPPAFNRVLIFRPTGAPHEVTRIETSAGKKVRTTITAFWLYS